MKRLLIPQNQWELRIIHFFQEKQIVATYLEKDKANLLFVSSKTSLGTKTIKIKGKWSNFVITYMFSFSSHYSCIIIDKKHDLFWEVLRIRHPREYCVNTDMLPYLRSGGGLALNLVSQMEDSSPWMPVCSLTSISSRMQTFAWNPKLDPLRVISIWTQHFVLSKLFRCLKKPFGNPACKTQRVPSWSFPFFSSSSFNFLFRKETITCSIGYLLRWDRILVSLKKLQYPFLPQISWEDRFKKTLVAAKACSGDEFRAT